jgi:pyruvate/2-oxoglutarate dehydrogenase complex dihydrolipoamide acyltransferase (E2) component
MKFDSDTASKSGRLRVPRSRALVTDILHFHQKSPNVAHSRRMQVAELAEARDRAGVRISWSALIIQAWSEICRRHPVLLQTWRAWPVRHIYQQQTTVANLAISRVHDSDQWLFWGLIRSPEERSLPEIQKTIDSFNNEPVDTQFQKQLTLSRLPTFARRIVWWWNLNISGEKRGKRLGTFSLTTISGRGAEIQHPPTVMTTGLTFAPIDGEGQMKVTLVYDHRLMDGSFIADRLIEFEEQLQGFVVTELRSLAHLPAASPPASSASPITDSRTGVPFKADIDTKAA